MKSTITMAALALLGFLVPGPVWADCELSCSAECKQEQVVCTGAAVLEAKIGRQQCETDAAAALVICESDMLDARADCVGLCGPDLKECGGGAKAAFKQCKETVKIERAGCENEVATLLAADRTACAEDARDCAASCVE